MIKISVILLFHYSNVSAFTYDHTCCFLCSLYVWCHPLGLRVLWSLLVHTANMVTKIWTSHGWPQRVHDGWAQMRKFTLQRLCCRIVVLWTLRYELALFLNRTISAIFFRLYFYFFMHTMYSSWQLKCLQFGFKKLKLFMPLRNHGQWHITCWSVSSNTQIINRQPDVARVPIHFIQVGVAQLKHIFTQVQW